MPVSAILVFVLSNKVMNIFLDAFFFMFFICMPNTSFQKIFLSNITFCREIMTWISPTPFFVVFVLDFMFHP